MWTHVLLTVLVILAMSFTCALFLAARRAVRREQGRGGIPAPVQFGGAGLGD